MPSFTCPACKKSLKTSTPIAAGKSVKCPKCEKVFKVPDQAAEVPPSTPPVRKKASVPADEDAPRRSPRGQDDDIQPLLSRKRKSGTPLMLGLAVSVVVLLSLLAMAAFVWPGFMVSSPNPAGKGDTDQIAKDSSTAPTDFTYFLNSKADFACGVNLRGANNAILKKALRTIADAKRNGDGMSEIVEDVDFLAMSGNTVGILALGPTVVVVQTAGAHNPEDVSLATASSDVEKLDGKTVFRSGEELYHMPDPRSIVKFKSLNDAAASKLMAADRSTVERGDLLEQINKVNGKTFWAVVALENNDFKLTAKHPQWQEIPGGKQLPSLLRAAKLLTLTGNLEEGSFKFELRIAYKDDVDAAKAVKILKPYVETNLTDFLTILTTGGKLEKIGIALFDDLRLVEIGSNGPNLAAAVKIFNKPYVETNLTDFPAILNRGRILGKIGIALLDDVRLVEMGSSGPNLTARLTLKKETMSELVSLVERNFPKPSRSVPRMTAAESRRRIQSRKHLKELALGLLCHHDIYKCFPTPATYDLVKNNRQPLLSWRVAILPYLDDGAYNSLYQEFKLDEPWNSPHNVKLLTKMPRIYAPLGVKTKEPYTTFYQALVGPDTVLSFGDSRNPVGRRIQTIFDGISNTIGIVEAGEPVPWTKPADLRFDPKGPLPKLGGTLFADGFHCSLVDGSVRFMRPAPAGVSPQEAAAEGEISEQTLRHAITCSDGNVPEPDW